MAYMNLEKKELWSSSNIDGFFDDFFEVDEVIAPVILTLNAKGYNTKFCCSGHPGMSYNEAQYSEHCTLDDCPVVGAVSCEEVDDEEFPTRISYVMPEASLYIKFAGESATPAELPEGFTFEDNTMYYSYKNEEYFAFLRERLTVCESLLRWAEALPQRIAA